MINGQDWTNYETWCVNRHLDGALHDVAREHVEAALDGWDVREDAVRTLAKHIEAMHNEAMPDVVGVFADLLSSTLSVVNWQEIAGQLVNAVDLYSAGWNMPGYMPDNPPSLFVDADDALEHLRSEIERAADETNDEPVDPTTIRAGSDGELGVTLGAYHYFITKV